MKINREVSVDSVSAGFTWSFKVWGNGISFSKSGKTDGPGNFMVFSMRSQGKKYQLISQKLLFLKLNSS